MKISRSRVRWSPSRRYSSQVESTSGAEGLAAGFVPLTAGFVPMSMVNSGFEGTGWGVGRSLKTRCSLVAASSSRSLARPARRGHDPISAGATPSLERRNRAVWTHARDSVASPISRRRGGSFVPPGLAVLRRLLLDLLEREIGAPVLDHHLQRLADRGCPHASRDDHPPGLLVELLPLQLDQRHARAGRVGGHRRAPSVERYLRLPTVRAELAHHGE